MHSHSEAVHAAVADKFYGYNGMKCRTKDQHIILPLQYILNDLNYPYH